MFFNSSSNGSATLIIYNLKGNKVFESTIDISQGKRQSILILSSLAQGVYYLKTVINGKIQETK